MSKRFIAVIGIVFAIATLCGTESYAAIDLRLDTWAMNLKNDNPLIRKSSARYLGQLGDKRAIPYLLKAIKDQEAGVRAEICNTLGLLGEESVKETLLNISWKDPSPLVRYSAKKAVENIETYVSLKKEKKLKELKEKLKKEEKAKQANPWGQP